MSIHGNKTLTLNRMFLTRRKEESLNGRSKLHCSNDILIYRSKLL